MIDDGIVKATSPVAVVTGASKGIGKAIASALCIAGYRVHGIARSSPELQLLRDEWSANFVPHELDVTGNEVLAMIESLGRIDVLVNNAGTNRPESFLEATDEALDLMLNLNVRAAFRIARSAARMMSAGGSIINMTSQMGHVGSPRRTVYCMTKHALEGLTKAMAVELAPMGIRVNSVAPTFVETPMTASMLEDPQFAAFVHRMIPLGKMATAEQIAAAVMYLASPAAGMVTGHSLVIDGGWTAQ
jgi:NAD(P)-dependent dehydrogenase (short-subunit alcohol dehydrogenase family)